MILVIDNYDSFTWNLVQLLGDLGEEVVVKRNDEVGLDEIETLSPDQIVLSPGPCTPAEAGISVDCVRRFGPTVPILGVCLGHQSIAAAYGGRVVRGGRVMHGKVSRIKHTGTSIFAGLPARFEATRYHSLQVEPSDLPPELEVTAWTDEEGWDTEIQAIRHTSHPVFGVQFHPESIASQAGRELLSNFLAVGS